MDRHLVMERLFLLRLGWVERERGRCFDVGNRNRLLRSRLMHRNGCRAALSIGRVQWGRRKRRRDSSGRHAWTSRERTRRREANDGFVVGGHHRRPGDNRSRW
jgi:hypothetical protein